MSALVSTASSSRERIAASASGAGPTAKKQRQRHTPGGARLGKEASREARRLAAAILEVLAGARTPSAAAGALGVSLPRYYQLEARALQALIAGCEARPRGPGRSADKELRQLRRQQERLERELGRQQALVRLAQRAIGLSPPKETDKAGGPAKGKKRRRRAVVRALSAARHLQEQSQEPAVPAAVPSAAEENTR
jgi:hypothetical protein